MAAAGFTVRALSISKTGTLFLGSAECSSRYRLWHRLLPRYSGPYRHYFQNGHSPLTPAMAVAIASTPYSSTVVDYDASLANSLLDRLRTRQVRELREQKPMKETTQSKKKKSNKNDSSVSSSVVQESFRMASSFSELGLTDELLSAIDELGLSQPTEVQCRSIPAVLGGDSVVVASHTGSGKTLAYMLPIVQLLRQEEIEQGKAPRPRRPRAVVLCPTRELAEQVYRVAKSICHHARFRATLIGGGVRMRPQEDALNAPIDMLVGTPGRLLKHIEDKNMAYGDIKYVVLDEADTMFDRGFGPDVKQFLSPLRNRAQKSENAGFQTILVTATITKAVQRLLDDEFPGIKHIRTSTLHKKVSTARHGFIKLAGTENKLESLLQVLEPSLSKGERVMVFCNTLNSCRAVDHFLNENNIPTVNYHGAVPAEERVEVLEKFREQGNKCPALVCTDLAARGLDLVVDHVIMFDFPLNSIDYLHRTGRTARMGARGKITSLVTKRSLVLAEQIESAIQKGETLEGISAVRKEPVKENKQVVKTELKTRRATIKSSKRVSQRSIPSSKLRGPKVDSKGSKKTAKIAKLTVSKPAFKLAKAKASINTRISKATKRLGQKSTKRG